MNPRSLPVLAWSICCAIASSAAAETAVQLRWLTTDPKTADALVSALKANTLAADAFDAKIDQQVKGGKITEVAAFNQKFVPGEPFRLKPATGKSPLMIEAEGSALASGGLDLRYCAEHSPRTPKGTGLLRINAATYLSSQHWHLLGRWSDAKTDSLLLGCSSGLAGPPPAPDARGVNAAHAPAVIHLDAEWRETTASDLAKVTQAPPESRAKALVWLRGRATLLGSATGTCKSGQKSILECLWGGKSDEELEQEAEEAEEAGKDIKEPPPRPGVTFEWEPSLAEDAKLPTSPPGEGATPVKQELPSLGLRLRLVATYVSLKAKAKTPAMEFDFQGDLRTGVPEFVAAKAPPEKGQPIVVLILTPWYEIIR